MLQISPVEGSKAVDGQVGVGALVNATSRCHVFFLRTSHLSLHSIQLIYHVPIVLSRLLVKLFRCSSSWVVAVVTLCNGVCDLARRPHCNHVPSLSLPRRPKSISPRTQTTNKQAPWPLTLVLTLTSAVFSLPGTNIPQQLSIPLVN